MLGYKKVLTGSDYLLLYSWRRSSYLQMLLENYVEMYIKSNKFFGRFLPLVPVCGSVLIYFM